MTAFVVTSARAQTTYQGNGQVPQQFVISGKAADRQHDHISINADTAQVNRDVPMLMLGLTRPTLFERRNYGPFADAQRIEQGALDKSSSRELANELLKKLPQIPAALRELITGVPLIVDAGVGTASDAAIAMELGADAVLMNTGIAGAQEPILMAEAMKNAVLAGRQAYLAGRMPKKLYATASSPLEGVVR